MNEYYQELNIRFIAQNISHHIQPEELALIESIMPDLILAMMQYSHEDKD